MTDGIHTDIPIDQYHSNDGYMSATQIKEANKSLKQWHWYMSGKMPREDKTHFSFGNAFELALMDKVGFSEAVAIMPDSVWIAEAMKVKDYQKPRSSKHYTDSRAKWEALNTGKYIIPDVGDNSWETIENMLESCYQDEAIQALIKNTEYQLSLYWTDEQTGLKLKTRPDICKRKKNVIVNVKTIEDGSPQSFSRDLAKWDYPLQACVEISGCLSTGLMTSVDEYFWLVCEKNPPYNATIYRFDESDQRATFDKLEYILNQIKKAKDEDSYPGYSQRADNKWGILTAVIPPWYY